MSPRDSQFAVYACADPNHSSVQPIPWYTNTSGLELICYDPLHSLHVLPTNLPWIYCLPLLIIGRFQPHISVRILQATVSITVTPYSSSFTPSAFFGSSSYLCLNPFHFVRPCISQICEFRQFSRLFWH